MSAVAAPAFRKASVTLSGRIATYHSRYEADWARYLDHLQQGGQIRAWVQNTTRFNLSEGVEYATKAGVDTAWSWTPDFLVWLSDGTCEIHEVSGWRHNRKAVQLEQFAIDYPNIPVREVLKADLIAIQKSGLAGEIHGWEVIR